MEWQREIDDYNELSRDSVTKGFEIVIVVVVVVERLEFRTWPWTWCPAHHVAC